MILTVTPNPSLDYLFAAARLAWEDANRVAAPRMRPGGQGINVARAARELGGEAHAVAFLGGRVGAELRETLQREGTPLTSVPTRGDTRVFVGVREEETGRSLLLNPRGPQVDGEETDALLEAVRGAIEQLRPSWVVCSGSVPPGAPPDLYARIARMAAANQVRFVADCDGESLRLASHEHCALLVPNAHEAERLIGMRVASIEDAALAADRLREQGAPIAVVKLGAEGAVLGNHEGTWHAAPPPLERGSAVGAGDALLAAVLLSLDRGESAPAVLAAGVAAGSAVLLARGEELLRRDDAVAMAERVRLRRLD